MKYVGLLVVLAIIYVVLSRRGPATSVGEAMKEADAVMATPHAPGAAPATPVPAGTGLRAPLDRTRTVLDQAKKRSGAGEF